MHKHLLNIPYNEMNCWELVCAYYKDVLNIELPSFSIMTNNIIGIAKEMNTAVKSSQWLIQDKPSKHCVVTFATRPTINAITHVGVMTSNSQFLHVLDNETSYIERLSNPIWKANFRGVYLWHLM